MNCFFQKLIVLTLLISNLNTLSYAQIQEESFLKAVPVWAGGRQVEKNLTVSFRAVIPGNNASDVLLRLTASSDYRAFVNGQFLGHGPCVAGFGYYRVDEHNISKLLQPGDNIIAIEVAGYNIDNYYLLNQPSFLQAEITSGSKVLAATDSRYPVTGESIPLFEAAVMNQRVQDVPKYSFQRPHMEAYKFSAGYNAWTTDLKAEFNRTHLERTETKNLIGRRVKYPDYTVRRYTEAVSDGIYKFECNTTGFIGASVQVNKPSRVTFTWDEILMEGDVNIRRLGCNSVITYELQPGKYVLESFEPYTLQYLKVQTEGDCAVSDFFIRQYVNSDVSRASFSCNDEKLNKIYEAAVETFKQNALDIFMDCPQRERAGWLCDSYFTARVAFNLSGNTLIETNFLENYLLPDKMRYIPDGMLQMCYPSDHSNGNFIPNWAMWFVLELEEYRQRSGNQQMIRDLQPKVMALLDYFKRYENEDGLLEKLEKWIFVEWSKANEFVQDVNYPTNMLYAKTLEVAGKLYQQPALVSKAEKIREVIRKQSFDGTFFIDHAVREIGKLVLRKNDRTETCQYYAFFLGIATPESHPGLWKILLNDFGPKRKTTKAYEEIYPSNAFIGNYLRLEMLSRYGQVRQLLNESIDEYLYMANITGTLWENTTTVASCNHGFASHVAHVFYRDMLGLNYIDSQKKQLNVVFNDTDVKTCKGTVPVGDQQISMQWEKKGKRLNYQLSVPDGYTVDIKNNTGLKLVAL
ncbi:MAG: hypothetical protein LBQ60_13965 [Bacteroidales bacterium]|jgi:hypothetical protein|nr:hypothetical protein [Bacteroidales bacterium]